MQSDTDFVTPAKTGRGLPNCKVYKGRPTNISSAVFRVLTWPGHFTQKLRSTCLYKSGLPANLTVNNA